MIGLKCQVSDRESKKRHRCLEPGTSNIGSVDPWENYGCDFRRSIHGLGSVFAQINVQVSAITAPVGTYQPFFNRDTRDSATGHY